MNDRKITLLIIFSTFLACPFFVYSSDSLFTLNQDRVNEIAWSYLIKKYPNVDINKTKIEKILFEVSEKNNNAGEVKVIFKEEVPLSVFENQFKKKKSYIFNKNISTKQIYHLIYTIFIDQYGNVEKSQIGHSRTLSGDKP